MINGWGEEEDNNFRSPIHLKLFGMILKSLSPKLDQTSKIKIMSMSKSTQEFQRIPSAVWHDWTDDNIRGQIIHQVLTNYVSATIEFSLQEKNQIQHSRELRIKWRNGKTCSLRMDEGIGCWGIHTDYAFPFETSVQDQAKFIMGMKGQVFMRQEELGTYINCSFPK